MNAKEVYTKHCPITHSNCKGSGCMAWKKVDSNTGDCMIMSYYDSFVSAPIIKQEIPQTGIDTSNDSINPNKGVSTY